MAQTRTTSDPAVPRGALLGAAALIGLTLTAAGLGRLAGLEGAPAPESVPLASVELRFEDQANGGIAVIDAADDQLVDVLAPGSNGFIRGALRGLARQRRLHDAGTLPPFRLTHWEDGRLSLTDTATGGRIYLDAFGETNRAAFAQLLIAGRTSQ